MCVKRLRCPIPSAVFPPLVPKISLGTRASAVALYRNLLPCHSPLFKHFRDHLIERRIVNTDVDHGVALEDRRQHFGDAQAVHFELDDRPLAAPHSAKRAEIGWAVRSLKLELDELLVAEALGDSRKRTVVYQFPMCNHQDALAQRLDV